MEVGIGERFGPVEEVCAVGRLCEEEGIPYISFIVDWHREPALPQHYPAVQGRGRGRGGRFRIQGFGFRV